MTNYELIQIKGGGLSATALNAIIRAFDLALELGRMVGSAIKRKISGSYLC